MPNWGHIQSLPPINDVFDSVGKVRILTLLASNGEVNITAISEHTGLNHVRVIAHLEELKSKYIVKEKKFGRIKIFSINQHSEAGKRLIQFLSDWSRDAKQKNRVTGEQL